MSPVASHLLIACASQHPTVRLLDLNSGASTHSLVGHAGTVLSVAWSPVSEHILASAGSDGTVRFWDIRRSVGELGVLDLEDSVGIVGYDGVGLGARRRGRGKAHSRAANGLVWTADGRHLVSTGHDERIRVWNMTTGANTLVNFGPLIRNSHPSTLLPLLTPPNLLPPKKDMLFFPGMREILAFDLFEGQLLNRFRVAPLPIDGFVPEDQKEQKGVRGRTTSLAWREHHPELYSGHGDGTIRAWLPRTTDDEKSDEIEKEEEAAREESRKRKRQALEEIYQNLTRRPGTSSWG
jgi:DNA excision repair protein ERCC-8